MSAPERIQKFYILINRKFFEILNKLVVFVKNVTVKAANKAKKKFYFTFY